MLGFAYELHLLLELTSVAVAGGMTAYVWNHRSEPSARPFMGMLLGIAAGGTIGVLHLLPVTPPLSPNVWRAWQSYCGIVPFLLFWGIFALSYTGYGNYVDRRTEAISLLIPIYLALGAIPHYFDAFGAIPLGSVLRSLFFLSVPIALGGILGLVFVGVGLLLITGRKYEHVNTRMYVVLILAAVFPILAHFGISIATSQDVPEWLLTIDYYLSGYFAAELMLALALFRYSVFSELPTAGRVGSDLAIEEMTEGMLVVDRDGRLLEINPAAEEIFSHDATDIVGEPLQFLVGTETDIVASDGVVSQNTPSEITLPGSDREFEAHVSPIDDQYGEHVGHVIILYDITNRKIREQQLEVLNRVLRHNLRNEISVVNTYAELLSDGNVERTDAASAIESASREVVEIGNKARTIERIIAEETAEYESFEFPKIVDSVSDHVTEKYPEVDVTATVPEGFTMVSRPQILEPVLRNVVENAAEHNDAAQPIVRISVSPPETCSDTTDITVADNGPGIPDHELEPLQNEAEVPLQHGSGLGLWLVRWGVIKLDGEISFTENEPRGTCVQISIPSQDRSVPP